MHTSPPKKWKSLVEHACGKDSFVSQSNKELAASKEAGIISMVHFGIWCVTEPTSDSFLYCFYSVIYPYVKCAGLAFYGNCFLLPIRICNCFLCLFFLFYYSPWVLSHLVVIETSFEFRLSVGRVHSLAFLYSLCLSWMVSATTDNTDCDEA